MDRPREDRVTARAGGSAGDGGRRLGLGLTLSGGGFRATLFHLGALRFLRDGGATLVHALIVTAV